MAPVTAVVVAVMVPAMIAIPIVAVAAFPVPGMIPRVGGRRVIPRRRAHRLRVVHNGWRAHDARGRTEWRRHHDRRRIIDRRAAADGDRPTGARRGRECGSEQHHRETQQCFRFHGSTFRSVRRLASRATSTWSIDRSEAGLRKAMEGNAECGTRNAEGQQPVLGLSKLAPGAPAEQGAPQEQQCQSGGFGNGNRTDVQKDCLGHI
jgi:hypothetical protein